MSPDDTLIQNMIANNSGNLIFYSAAYKILATRGTTVTADRLLIDPGQADRINERYDAYVIPPRERPSARVTSPSWTGRRSSSGACASR